MLPFVLASFALGFGALGPYLIVREQREGPIAKSELGWYTRTIAESKVFMFCRDVGSSTFSAGRDCCSLTSGDIIKRLAMS